MPRNASNTNKGAIMAKTGTASERMTVAEAAAYLGLRPGTLNAWRSTGKGSRIPFIKLGGAIRYDKSVLDRFMAENTADVVAK